MHYSDLDMNQHVINSPNNTELKESLAQMVNDQRNLDADLYLWIKGETYDLNAMQVAIDIRNASTKKIKELTKKNKNTEKDIENLNAGKKGMNTMFKTDVGQLQNKVSTREQEIDWQVKLANFLTIYLGEKCIDGYKKEKFELYRKILMRFHVGEISNHHKKATFWTRILNDPNVKQSAVKQNE